MDVKPNHPLQVSVVLLALIGPVVAQQPADSPANDEGKALASGLGVRQLRVKQMMLDLDRKFKSLAQTLGNTEPERAERLIKALRQSKEMLIEQRMDHVVRALDDWQLDAATDEQRQIITDLKQLIEVLLEEEGIWEKVQKEIELLEQWRDQIKQLLGEQRKQHRESQKIDQRDKTLAELGKQIKALEMLIKEQEAVIRNTEQVRAEGIQGLGRVADQQREVRHQTQSLADEIRAGYFDGAQPPADSRGDRGAGARHAQRGSQSPEAGQQSLDKAVDHQRSAEQQLGQGRGKAGQQAEENALAELNKALDQLRRERSRITSLPPEIFDQLADAQDETENKTGQLGDQMAEASGSGSSQPGGGGASGGQPGSQPPQQQVQSAQKSMQQASRGLKRHQPGSASGDQAKAINQLEEALEEIEDRLRQLREEMQMERLARLEARFREMLARQEKVTRATLELHKKKTAAGPVPRADRLALGKLAEEERVLSHQAQQALEIIIEDGTSVVFPAIVEQLRDDLRSVAGLLAARRTGSYTQNLQIEIEQTLKELIEALQQAQELKQQGGGGGGGGDEQDEPLLPNSAELKLLRSAQLRVNRRTASFDQARPDGPLDELMKKQIRDIADFQEEIAIMAEEMLESY